MDTSEVFAARLRNARIMNGYSLDDLVRKMNGSISKMAVSKFENGIIKPNSSTLIALSEALNLPVDYFFRPFDFKIESIRFRKKSRLPKKQELAIKEQIRDIIERYSSIEEICNEAVSFEGLGQEVSTVGEAEDAARKVRSLWSLGNSGIVNAIALLEEHGVKIVEIEAPETFDGLSSMVNGSRPVLVLNTSFTPERMRFTAMHELAHLMMKPDPALDDRSVERLCDSFAGEMLLPESEFRTIIGNKRKSISYQEMSFIQRQFGISCDAIMHKAKTSLIISEQSYRSYCIMKNKSPRYRSLVEQSLYPIEEASRFDRLVYKALSNSLITASTAAAILNRPVETLISDTEYI